MQCARCQHENPPQAKFCLECGTRVAHSCAHCRTELPAGAKFCLECGHAVGSQPAPLRFPSPEAYIPKHLAERILTSRAALEGERKQVTVLFADLKGSMELLADRDPEEARKLLDPVLERMMEAVHHYEGTVNQVMGDGIMALFGAPVAHEDHAVRACFAALRMQRRINLYADEIQRAGGTPVQIRVGLNSGEVVVRSVGSDLRMDYSAVGQTTHLAARMEQMAKPGSVLVTGETLKLAEGYIQVRPLGAVAVKGLEAPTQVYELNGIVSVRSRFQASAARGLTRFVGRDGEMQQLAQALERAAAGHGQAVAIVGDAGVGKSRLVWEFIRSHRIRGWLVLESGSVSYGKATPYLPAIDLLKAYCRIQEGDDQREIRERVAGKLLTLDRGLEPLLTPLLALLDVSVDDAPWEALDPPQRRQRTLEALKRLLLRESHVQPLLVIFEDLHWIDAETQALLDSLIESLPTARVLLLVNYRPEYEHGWGRKSYYLQLRIDPLPPESAEALLDGLLGEDRTLEPLKRVLIERTEGNPFFLEESVQTLTETRVLVGERGSYRMVTTPDAWQIPATAQAILAARIDRLSPEDKRLLQAASVIGKDVPGRLLREINEGDESSLTAGLARLQAAEFLHEATLFPDTAYTFKHALTHEVAYGSLLHKRRRAIHGRVVDALERVYGDRLGEQVERLGQHALRGELWEKAVEYLSLAGQKAVGRATLREAEGYFEQALVALGRLPESPERIDRAIDQRVALRNVLYVLGEHDRALDTLQEAEKLARARGDRRRLLQVLGYISTHFVFTELLDRAREYAKQTIVIAEEVGDPELQIPARVRLGIVHMVANEYAEGIDLFRALVPMIEDELPKPRLMGQILTSVMIMGQLAQLLAECGQFAEAGHYAEEAIRRAERLEPRYSLAIACLWAGRAYLWRGDLRTATRVLERSVETARSAGVGALIPGATSHLGLAYARAGRHGEALPLLTEAIETSSRGFEQGLHVVMLGEVHLLAGRVPEASEVAGRALRRAIERQEPGCEAWARRLLGDVELARAPRDGGEGSRHFAEALTLASRLGMRPLVAHCHIGLAKTCLKVGEAQAAARHLSTAVEMYRAMGMSHWLPEAEALSQEVARAT